MLVIVASVGFKLIPLNTRHVNTAASKVNVIRSFRLKATPLEEQND